MSWLYSQALVVEYLAASCSDGAPFAPLSGKPTPQAYCAPARTTAHSRLSRFGMTCAPLMADRGAELLTWYLAAFHAKTSAQPARVQALKASAVECGQKWPASSARYDHDLRLWKTAQCSLLEGLDVYSETWPRWGTMRGGECWAQLMPVLRTSATVSGLWLTPTCMNIEPTDDRRTKRAQYRATVGRQDAPGGLAEQVMTRKFWPTATARDWKGANTEQALTRKDGKSRMDQLANAVAWPTPTAQEGRYTGDYGSDGWRAGCAKHHLGNVVQVANGGQLNPTWVEWLMGWPLEWTDLKPLATDKFPQWLRSHGKC